MSTFNLTDIGKAFFHSPLFYRLMRLVLGVVFIFAGVSKLMDPGAFARTISVYGLLPDALLVPACNSAVSLGIIGRNVPSV